MRRSGKGRSCSLVAAFVLVSLVWAGQQRAPKPPARSGDAVVASAALAALGANTQDYRGVVLTQLPGGPAAPRLEAAAGGTLRAFYGEGARIIRLRPDGTVRVLTGDFHSAADPDVSFDGRRLLFAGKKAASDSWQVFEMTLESSEVRQVTREAGDCRMPVYQSQSFDIIEDVPQYRIAFIGHAGGHFNEYGPLPSSSLFSCRPDGTQVRRMVFHPSSVMDPFVAPDGRILFSAWQRNSLQWGWSGRLALFGVNLDGTDFALYLGNPGARVKQMPCVTTGGLVVFVEADHVEWDGAGALAAVESRRPLHTYRRLTSPAGGLFHSPAPLPDGAVLVSRRLPGASTHEVCRFEPQTGKLTGLFDDPAWHDVQARIIAPRREPDGRSSAVNDKYPTGKLYCLNVYNTDWARPEWWKVGTVKKLRVLEGLPRARSEEDAYLEKQERTGIAGPGATVDSLSSLLQTRLLGVVDVEQDGSFQVEVPANTPIQLQLLDENGVALESCSWIWARNNENRGCIGCHEDPELVPENVLAKALAAPAPQLTLPPERRRTIDFTRDVAPILERRCAAAACHGGRVAPKLHQVTLLGTEGSNGSFPEGLFNLAYRSLLAAPAAGVPAKPGQGRYVHPGSARTSPLIRKLVGRDLSRPWDRKGLSARAPGQPHGGLTPDELQTFIEWIDFGAHWNPLPGASPPTPARRAARGGKAQPGGQP